ncbi:MAG: PIG-L deacetylase family protein [Pyrinomonadaceae bacterium]
MQSRNLLRVLLPLLLSLALLSAVVPTSPARTQDPSPSPPTSPSPAASPAPEQTPSPSLEPAPTPDRQIDRIALHQALLDLSSPWTVMCVAAHPDDEDGTTLTILRRKHGVHTVTLFSTYGEGGQNAVGPELYEELGVIRARETMAAAQIQGSEAHFLGLRDFGFSKSADETFQVWGKTEALRRMVEKIRQLRPDVIITNHDPTGGHGHHQATGRLILEAFDAAADPKSFPEQLERLSVWQPQRLFVRVREATKEAQKLVTIDPNERDPVRGTTYAEQALAALQQHATQGPWPKTIAERLRAQNNNTGSIPLIRYGLVREAQGPAPLPNEGQNLLAGLSVPESARIRLAPPTISGHPLTEFIDQPERILNALIDWRRRERPTPEVGIEDLHRVKLIAERGSQALALAAGLTLTVISRSAVLVPGVATSFAVNLSNTGERSVQLRNLSFAAGTTRAPLEAAEVLMADTETSVTGDRVTPPTAPLTVPSSAHLYDGRLFGERLVADAELEIDGARFSLSAQTSIDVAPAVEIKKITPTPYVWTPAAITRPLLLRVRLLNNLPAPFRGIVRLSGAQYHIFEVGREILLEPNETRDLTIQSNAIPIETRTSRRGRPASVGQLLLSVQQSDSARVITEQSISVVLSDARVTRALRVGYLPSFDKTLQQSLAALAVDAKELSIADIKKPELVDYDTIIIDNRGYQAHPELTAVNSLLLDYVRKGGTLIVFYHKDNEWNPNPEKGRPQLAPYSIILDDERVTDETAPVHLLQPGHPLLNLPNRITLSDFNNWVQERGLYYPKEWDRHYQVLLATSDKGEPLQRGGLLVAPYGRGHYIYTSMVWYRQLAAGVPGGYRMFANMISYGHQLKKRRKPLR